MKTLIRSVLILGLGCLSLQVAQAEPTNLQIHKNELMTYVNNGTYLKEQEAVAQKASTYLKQYVTHHQQEKLAVVLDIDETALSNYPDMVKLSFGGTLDEINQREADGDDPVIAPTLDFYNQAQALGVKVFFITGRTESERQKTVENLKAAGYKNWAGLILRNDKELKLSASAYKTPEREAIEAQGYTIVINMGDQASDLNGGHAVKGFKLPNPFYIVP